MKTNIMFGVNIKRKELVYDDTKGHTVKSEGLNGYYDYISNTIAINLESSDFKDKDEADIILTFGKIVTHEILHSEIYKVTGKYATEKEEEVIYKIVGV